MLPNGSYVNSSSTFSFPADSFQQDPNAGVANSGKNAIDMDEIKRLRTQHDMYKRFAPEWKLYLDAYEGGTDFANADNLFKHRRETSEDYGDRVDRLHYINHCEPLISFFTNFIFGETIQRDGGQEDGWYQEFILDVNKKGDNVTEFMREVSDSQQVFGMLYVLVDTPAVAFEGEVMTKAQEEELGLSPYWIIVKPDEVWDWRMDQFDRPMYVKRMQYIFDTIAGQLDDYEKYSEWYTDHVVISYVKNDEQGKAQLILQETFPNTLGKIPIVCFKYKRSKKYPGMGLSFLKDFAYNSREVMNLTSLLQEFLYRQCFNILAKETDQLIPIRDESEGVLSSANILEYPKGAQLPAYLSPPAAPAEFVQSERQRIITEMFRRAAQDSMNELFNGEGASGFSQAQSFSKTVPYISSRADQLEKGETDLMKLTMALRTKAWDGKIKYKDRYELTNITDAITQLTMLFRDWQFPSETFVKGEMKRMVQEMDGKISPDQINKINGEIDGMDFDGWMETMKAALIGQPPAPDGTPGGSGGTSPASQQKDKSTGTMAEAASEARAGTGATKKVRKK